MGAKLRLIRRRIRSVQSTMKITRAMELIAASRILKAQQRVEAARPYAERLTEAMEDVARQTGSLEHPLLEDRRDPKRAAVFIVRSALPLRPIDKRFLPVAPEEIRGQEERGEPTAQYIFDPEPAELLDALLPRYVTAK